ncbi:hypothetical protein B0H14DRAFT_3536835 [Mycena olivaceomarginata]|nr:hypothetical protein B0H14DRAFT_3536835 [Mycena olivaceomarginata]
MYSITLLDFQVSISLCSSAVAVAAPGDIFAVKIYPQSLGRFVPPPLPLPLRGVYLLPKIARRRGSLYLWGIAANMCLIALPDFEISTLLRPSAVALPFQGIYLR